MKSAVTTVDGRLATVWPTMFGYQLLYAGDISAVHDASTD